MIETPCEYCGSEPNGSMRHSCKKEYGYWMCGTHSWIIGEVRGQKCIDIAKDRRIAEMKGLLETAVNAHEFKRAEGDRFESVTLHSTWFEAAREIVHELDMK